ncbi:hypothetical protein C2E23DRAFT_804835 [Lenzites betulinus]|nr:hypothetical protein C2E23DRAFT_804835 [Lenzites betulinus]
MVGAVDFATADGTRGIPVRMLMASRRALHSGMQNPKWKCFAGWHRDTEWVRIRWPAYPQHVAPKSIVVSQRVRFKKPRRPVTRLELAVALAGVITEYYSEATSLEPAPEYAHLALGSAEGRVSLYGLLMVCLRPAADGIFDLVLELIGDEDAMKPRIVRRIDVAELDNLIAVPDVRLDSVPPPEAGPSIEGVSGAGPAGPETTVLKVERASTPTLQ